MLDSSHPLTKHIFEAGALEGDIQARLVAWKESGAAMRLPPGVILEIKDRVAALHALNRQHFGANPGITRKLGAIEDAVVRGNCEASWKAHLALAHGQADTFETWAI